MIGLCQLLVQVKSIEYQSFRQQTIHNQSENRSSVPASAILPQALAAAAGLCRSFVQDKPEANGGMGQISSAFNDGPPRRIGNGAMLCLYGRASFGGDQTLSSPFLIPPPVLPRLSVSIGCLTSQRAWLDAHGKIVMFSLWVVYGLPEKERTGRTSKQLRVGSVPCEGSVCDVMGRQPCVAASSCSVSLPEAIIKVQF